MNTETGSWNYQLLQQKWTALADNRGSGGSVRKEDFIMYILNPYLSSLGYNIFDFTEVKVDTVESTINVQTDIGEILVVVDKATNVPMLVDKYGSGNKEGDGNETRVILVLKANIQEKEFVLYSDSLSEWVEIGRVTFTVTEDEHGVDEVNKMVTNYNEVVQYIDKGSLLDFYQDDGERIFTKNALDNLLSVGKVDNRFLRTILREEISKPSDEFLSLLVDRLYTNYTTRTKDLLMEDLKKSIESSKGYAGLEKLVQSTLEEIKGHKKIDGDVSMGSIQTKGGKDDSSDPTNFRNEEEEEAERLEEERIAKEKAEQEEQERLEQERLEAERLEAEEQERIAKEKAEQEEQERLEQEHLEQERLEAEEQERKEKEKQERLEAERKEKERLEAEEQERKEKEKQERLEAERKEKERLEQERLEAERKEKEKQERLEAERKEKEKQERLEAERKEKEKQERLEAERKEKEEQERLEQERLEQERLEQERKEKEEQDRKAKENKEGIDITSILSMGEDEEETEEDEEPQEQDDSGNMNIDDLLGGGTEKPVKKEPPKIVPTAKEEKQEDEKEDTKIVNDGGGVDLGTLLGTSPSTKKPVKEEEEDSISIEKMLDGSNNKAPIVGVVEDEEDSEAVYSAVSVPGTEYSVDLINENLNNRNEVKVKDIDEKPDELQNRFFRPSDNDIVTTKLDMLRKKLKKDT